ncbi:hypothetical protein JCM19000A_05630 [Silvimonas sp. JCM 19000]
MIIEAFDAKGIGFAIPVQTVYHHGGSDVCGGAAGASGGAAVIPRLPTADLDRLAIAKVRN